VGIVTVGLIMVTTLIIFATPVFKKSPQKYLIDSAISLLYLLHIIAMAKGLYEHGNIDLLLHTYGGFLCFFAIWIIATQQKKKLSIKTICLIGILGTLCIGALWEGFEWMWDTAMEYSNMPKAQKGTIDTITDMLANGGGAVLAAVSIQIKHIYKKVINIHIPPQSKKLSIDQKIVV